MIAPSSARLIVRLGALSVFVVFFQIGVVGPNARKVLEKLGGMDVSKETLPFMEWQEGTLGGLVRQGEPGRLDRTVTAAVANAAICSSDPLCIESAGQGTNALNLAACHACALLPETSCEEGNLLLDRVVVLGKPDQPEIGFFSTLLT